MKGHYYNGLGQEIPFLTDLIHPARITSFVGGGGKTTSMLALGWELCGQNHETGRQTCCRCGQNYDKGGQVCSTGGQGFPDHKNNKVIMTTTTRILPFPDAMLRPGLSCLAAPMEDGKLGPLDRPDRLVDRCDYLLIEADGSRGLPVKVPKHHEPVLTNGTGLVIAVMGLSGIGKKIRDVCHRPELVCRLLGKRMEDSVEIEDAITILLSPMGLRKDVGERDYAVILNQADGERERRIGAEIATGLPGNIPCIMSTYPSE